MGTPSYKTAYLDLIKPENVDAIKAVLLKSETYDAETLEQIHYEEENGLPYLFAEVESNPSLSGTHYGMVDGSFHKLEEIYPAWPGVFYLPIVFVLRPKNPRLKILLEKRDVKAHELEHLRDLMDYIDAHPSYIERAQKLCLAACTPENLAQSIQFEVEKIFQKEAAVAAKDYLGGETCVSIAADGAAYEIKVDSVDRFVKYQVALYLGGLFERYLEKLPEHRDLIGELYKKEVEVQGRALYGPDPLPKIGIMIVQLFKLRFLPHVAAKFEVGELE
jgi:hypothetical protein